MEGLGACDCTLGLGETVQGHVDAQQDVDGVPSPVGCRFSGAIFILLGERGPEP